MNKRSEIRFAFGGVFPSAGGQRPTRRITAQALRNAGHWV